MSNYIGGSVTTPLRDQLQAALQSGLALGTGQAPGSAEIGTTILNGAYLPGTADLPQIDRPQAPVSGVGTTQQLGA